MCYVIQLASRQQDICNNQHIFDRIFVEHCIDQRPTKMNHPWTNGQVERMNRTTKDATVKRHHRDGHTQLQTYLHQFVDAHYHERRLKILFGSNLPGFS
ncbi:hypothetical protein MOTC310_23970 [Methylobacterium oryzae]|uniref:Integrase catalytic domain-containing protein n=1 Tax=Methylobacterium oryzae TaxID=334852 RepID=A0ABU7TU09_9HYPH